MQYTKQEMLFILALALVTALQIGVCEAKTYKVGDDKGWTQGVNITKWAEGKTFYGGDVLVFVVNGSETIYETNSAAYEECLDYFGNPFADFLKNKTWTANVTLSLGVYYFISANHDHCESGLKLKINVTSWAPGQAPTLYTVGDSKGWTRGVNYTEWTKGKTFYVRDILEFVFNETNHTLVEIPEESFASCNYSSIIPPMVSWGHSDNKTWALNVTLTLGKHYYTSLNQGDCNAGMKLAVNALDRSGTNVSDAPAGGPSAQVESAAAMLHPLFAGFLFALLATLAL